MKDIMIITGVTQGIGYALANAFANQYEVVGLDIGEDPNIKGVSFYQVDLGETEALKRVFEDVKSRFGHAHVLINNGGGRLTRQTD
jgi:NAD(P)-dependent dehydrogenase (short-subunit alcohol dehydrogenase family)